MTLPFDPYLLFFNFWEKFSLSFYFKPVLILGGIFFLVILLAYARERLFQVSMRGAVFGFLLGVIFMLLIDFLLILGLADKTKWQKLSTSGEKRQEIIGEILVSGVSNLGQVLGTSNVSLSRKPKTAQEVIVDLLTLPQEETEEIRSLFCPESR